MRGRWYSTVSRFTSRKTSFRNSQTRFRSRRWMRRTRTSGSRLGSISDRGAYQQSRRLGPRRGRRGDGRGCRRGRGRGYRRRPGRPGGASRFHAVRVGVAGREAEVAAREAERRPAAQKASASPSHRVGDRAASHACAPGATQAAVLPSTPCASRVSSQTRPAAAQSVNDGLAERAVRRRRRRAAPTRTSACRRRRSGGASGARSTAVTAPSAPRRSSQTAGAAHAVRSTAPSWHETNALPPSHRTSGAPAGQSAGETHARATRPPDCFASPQVAPNAAQSVEVLSAGSSSEHVTRRLPSHPARAPAWARQYAVATSSRRPRAQPSTCGAADGGGEARLEGHDVGGRTRQPRVDARARLAVARRVVGVRAARDHGARARGAVEAVGRGGGRRAARRRGRPRRRRRPPARARAQLARRAA